MDHRFDHMPQDPLTLTRQQLYDLVRLDRNPPRPRCRNIAPATPTLPLPNAPRPLLLNVTAMQATGPAKNRSQISGHGEASLPSLTTMVTETIHDCCNLVKRTAGHYKHPQRADLTLPRHAWESALKLVAEPAAGGPR
jgi:hypothetical protein